MYISGLSVIYIVKVRISLARLSKRTIARTVQSKWQEKQTLYARVKFVFPFEFSVFYRNVNAAQVHYLNNGSKREIIDEQENDKTLTEATVECEIGMLKFEEY